MRAPTTAAVPFVAGPDRDRRLGVFDWGAGGMGLVKHLRTLKPDWPLCYVSDAGYTPYGKVPKPELERRMRQILHWFRAQGVTHVAVACNAASTVFPQADGFGRRQRLSTTYLTPNGTLRVTHVVQHALAARALFSANSVGIVGGKRTIQSGVYRALAQRCHVISRVAQPLSAFVEAGELTSQRVRDEVRRIVRPLHGVDVLVLACTHYPALLPLFQEALPQVQLIDPAADMARWIAKHWLVTDGRQRSQYFTTGECAALARNAQAAFGVRLTSPVRQLQL